MKIETTKSPTGIQLSIEGRAGVAESEELATAFRGALGSGLPVSLRLQGLEAVDVSFIQLLVSLELSLSRRGHALVIGPLPGGHCLSRASDLLGVNLRKLLATKAETA